MTDSGRVRRTPLASILRRSVFIREAGALGTAQLAGLVAMLVQVTVVARLLGPRGYGVLGLLLTYPSVLYTFLDARSSDAVVKYLGEFDAKGDLPAALALPKLAYTIDAVVALITFLLVSSTAVWAEHHVIKAPGTAPLLVVYGLAILLASPLATSRGILAHFRQFSTLAKLQAFGTCTRTGLVIVFVALGFGVAGAIWGSAVGLVVEGWAGAVFASREVRTKLGSSWRTARQSSLRAQRKGIFTFIFYTDLSSLVGVFVKQADLVILGFFRGPTDVGYYRLARSIASLADNLVIPLQSVVYPRFSYHSGLNDVGALRQSSRRYLLFVGLPLAGVALLALPFMPVAIKAVAGTEYIPAVGLAQLLVIGAAAWLALFWVRPLLFALGWARFYLVNSIVVVAICLLAFLVLTPSWGATGMALSKGFILGVGGNVAALVYLSAKIRRLPPEGTRADVRTVLSP